MNKRTLVGTVTHYFSRIRVAGIMLSDQLTVGDRILIIGHTTALEQIANSIELDHQQIDVATPSQEIGLRVIDRVRKGDEVYRLAEAAA